MLCCLDQLAQALWRCNGPAACLCSCAGLMCMLRRLSLLQEIKNGRLAMLACLGFAAQHAATGQSPLEALAAHLANPMAVNLAT